MPSVPRVSIIIPTYNSAGYLRETVDGIKAQTFTSWELLLLDDGSTDDTVEVAREVAAGDPRIRVIIGDHSGIAGARNRGFRESNPDSEFITFFDHDDLWEPEALGLLVDALDRNPACVASHALARAVDLQGQQIEGDDHADVLRNRQVVRGNSIVDLPVTATTPFEAFLVRNFTSTPGTSLLRREAFAAIKGFEPATVPCDDWDMNLRLTRLGDYAFVDKVILNWRRHEGNASNSSKRWRQSYLLVRKRTVQWRDATPQHRESAKQALLLECRDIRSAAGRDAFRGKLLPAARQLLRATLLYSVYLRSCSAT